MEDTCENITEVLYINTCTTFLESKQKALLVKIPLDALRRDVRGIPFVLVMK